MSRRALLKGGGAAFAGLTVMQVAGPAHAFPGHPGDEVIPWLDQPAENPVPEIVPRQLVWEQLDSWLTPAEEFFIVSHYGNPAVDPADYRLSIAGLARRWRRCWSAQASWSREPRWSSGEPIQVR